MRRIAPLLLAACVAAALSLAGCVVHTGTVTVQAAGYRPPTYQGRTVYFTPKGGPFICHAQYRERLPDSLRSRYSTYYYNHERAYEHWVQSHPAPCSGGAWHAPATGTRSYHGGKSRPRTTHPRRSHPRR